MSTLVVGSVSTDAAACVIVMLVENVIHVAASALDHVFDAAAHATSVTNDGVSKKLIRVDGAGGRRRPRGA